MKRENKKSKRINIKWIVISTVIGIIVALFPFLALLYLKIATTFLHGDLLVITEAVESWFSTIISYSGVIVSVILGIITLHLTISLDNMNTKNTIHDNKLQIATNIPNMKSLNMKLYALCEEHSMYDYFGLFETKRNFILSYEMEPAFPPYFDLTINSMRIKVKRLTEEGFIEENSILTPKDYVMTNNDKFKTIINIPVNLEKPLKYLYMLNNITTQATPSEKKIADIWIGFKCRNILIDKIEMDGYASDAVDFYMHFKVINMGIDIISNQGIELEIINRQFEYRESEDK